MNKVMLMGRLTRDPEIRYSNAAEPLAIARYSLAVDRPISRERRERGDQSVDFINCTAFGRSAEFVEKYFRKGLMVGIVGRIQVRSYDDNTGQKRWATEVVTDEHFFGESRASFESRGQGHDGGQNYNYQGQGQNQAPSHGGGYSPPAQQQPPADNFFEVDSGGLDDNDLPF